MTDASQAPVRVVVVDDSAFNRKKIADLLAASGEVEVVGTAADGDEALRLVTTERPDVITLDLEMPKMDGFTFLRILMNKLPTPVVVVSSYSQKENVFKALELGALDFVAKPSRDVDADISAVQDELIAKVLLTRSLRPAALTPRRVPPEPTAAHEPREPSSAPPKHVVAIGASTGGPTALIEVVTRLPARRSLALLVAQHMPDKFTRTFAERLDRRCTLRINEAQDRDLVTARTGFVCPGKKCMELVTDAATGELRLRVRAPDSTDRYVPSADRLFMSVARAAGPRAVGVILTGMGDDGVEGARAILQAGGTVIAESELTAVVYGMPAAAMRAGVVTRSLPLGGVADFVAALGV
jgi:two-component system chemotaxis response regulator CheB